MANYLYLPTAVPFAGAVLMVILHTLGLRKAQRGAAIALAIAAVFASILLLQATTPVEETYFTWISLADGRLPVTISYQLDDLSRFFQVLPPLLGLSVIVFEERATYLTRALIFGLLGAGQSLILANDLLLIYASWEVFLLLAAALLLHQGGAPVKGAATWSGPGSKLSSQELVSALALPHACGYLLLAGFLIVGLANDSLAVSKIHVSAVHGTSLYLVSIAVLARITPFSLQIWPDLASVSPRAMSFLSGGMASWMAVYVFSRWIGLTDASRDHRWTLLIAAAATAMMILSVLRAMNQTHLIPILNSLSLSQASLALLGLCLGGMQATAGAFFQLLGGSLLLLTLLLCTEVVVKAMGTDAAPRLRGLATMLPVTAGLFLGATVLLAGMPLFGISFFAQWLIYAGGLHGWFAVFVLAGLAAGAGTFAVLIRAGFSVFLGRDSRFAGKEIGEEGLVSVTELVPPYLNFASIAGTGIPLVGACLAGLVPWLVYGKLTGPAAALTTGSPAKATSFLATLVPGGGDWAPYAVPALMLMSVLAGFALYYRNEMEKTGSPAVSEGTGDQIIEVSDSWEGNGFAIRRADLPGRLAAFVLRAILGLARAGEKLVAAFEARYYVVTALLCALLVLFVLLE